MDDDEVERDPLVPSCSADGMRMSSTIVGWRCPICGFVPLSGVA
jgi:predicted RNA-binding Zn-ribbon protein involved in translation (DUF1610 family)